MKNRIEMYKELLCHDKETYFNTIRKVDIGELYLSTGRIVACDPLGLFDLDAFLIQVKPGYYPVSLYLHTQEDGTYVSFSSIRFSTNNPVSFELAFTSSNQDIEVNSNEYVGFSVDTGCGSYMDASVIDILKAFDETRATTYLEELEALLEKGSTSYHPDTMSENIIAFTTGYGDGIYPTYFGLDENQHVCCLISDYFTLELKPQTEIIDLGTIYDSGYNHASKINRLNLKIEDINGFNHLAVYLKWCYEHHLLSDSVLKIIDPKNDFRSILIHEPVFNGRLTSKHFNELGVKFTDYFYVFNTASTKYYPHCVDDFAKKVLGEELYYCKEYQDEAYLYNPYNEDYIKGLSVYIEKAWQRFLKENNDE